MKNLWHRLIARLFPGTPEEYYSAREIHLHEMRAYSRQPLFILGQLLVAIPVFALVAFSPLPALWKLLLLPVVVGYVFVMDTITEHYCLLLLRKSRHSDDRAA